MGAILKGAECEEERRRAAQERNAAEEERRARLVLEKNGKDLKETLVTALARIENLEASQAAERNELQQLRNEVKLAVDGFRAAVKTAEEVQSTYHNLERNLTAKVNNASNQFSKAGQNVQLQNGLKAVQASVNSIQKELFSLSSRVATSERQHSQWEQRISQLTQLQQQAACQDQAGRSTSTSDNVAVHRAVLQKVPPKPAQRYASTPSGGIEVIPGIESILRPPVRQASLKSPGGGAKKAGNKRNAIVSTKKAVEVDTVKDGSDVTVLEDSSAASRNDLHVKLLESITRLFQKEKRTHSKIEAKLDELGRAIIHPGLPPQGKKRKATSSHEGHRKAARKHGTKTVAEQNDAGSTPGHTVEKQEKVQEDQVNYEEILASITDTEGNALVQKWLTARKNLLTPSLPEVPVPKPTSRQDNQGTALSKEAEAKYTGNSTPSASSKSESSNFQICKETSLTDTTPAIDLQKELPSEVAGGGHLECRNNDVILVPDPVIPASRQVKSLLLTHEHFDGESLSNAVLFGERFKDCFYDSSGDLKAPESWKLEFETRFRPLLRDNEQTHFTTFLISSIVSTLVKRQERIVEFARFIDDVVLIIGADSAFDVLVKNISSFLIHGKTQTITAVIMDLDRGERRIESCSSLPTQATVEEVTLASKLLAALCGVSGNFRLLQSVTYRILRWNQMDNLLMATMLASVSEQLFSEGSLLCSAVRCIASELAAESDIQGNDAGYLQDGGTRHEYVNLPEIQRLRHLGVTIDETVQDIVNSSLQLLYSEETGSLPGFDLTKAMGYENLTAASYEKGESISWNLRFHEAAEALELVSLHMGWEWTYNDLIVGKLWTLVVPGAAQVTFAGVAYLLGSLGRLGVDDKGDEMPGVDQLRQRLAVMLKEVTSDGGRFSFSTRLVAARALFELSTRDDKAAQLGGNDIVNPEGIQVLHPEYVTTVQEWFQSLDAEQQDSVPRDLRERFFVKFCT